MLKRTSYLSQLIKKTVAAVSVSAVMLSATNALGQVPDLVAVPMEGTNSTGLPNLGGESGGLSWSEEREIGDYIAALIRQDLAYERDPLLHDYVFGIWTRLLSSARASGELSAELQQRMAWEMFVIKDPSVNAFALPGAYVGVNLGLIAVVETRDELASVLAHESVHIFQRHIARMYGVGKTQTTVSLASILLGLLVIGIDPNLGGAIITGGTAVSAQSQINFVRMMEHEADRIGYKVLVGAGFRPEGMAEMFGRLAQATRYSDTTNFPYLMTHPLTDTRIAEAQMRFGVGLAEYKTPEDLLQRLMSARAIVLANGKPDALKALVDAAYDSKLKEVRVNVGLGQLYAGAFAAVKSQHFNEANQIWEQLIEVAGDDPELQKIAAFLGVEIALAERAPEKAQQRLELINPQVVLGLERTELFLRMEVALASGEASSVVKRLEAWAFNNPKDDYGWELLAKAYRQNAQPILSLRAEAESRMAIGDYNGAVDRFKAAINSGNSSNSTVHDLELIQARVKVAEEALKQRQMIR